MQIKLGLAGAKGLDASGLLFVISNKTKIS